MPDESRGEHPDVDVTVRQVEGAPRPPRANPLRAAVRWDVAVLLAMAAVAVALLYSAVQARDSAREADASRRALVIAKRESEFANVLDLHQKIFDAYRRTSTTYWQLRGQSGPDTEVRLIEAVTPLEGIAYLLNHNMTPIPRAAEIWKRYLICAFYTARARVGSSLDLQVPELASFARARRPTIGARSCATIVLSRHGP